MSIRNSAKAIIIHEDKLLLTKNQDQEGCFYLFPGGGQEYGETLHNALIRECIEETGREIKIGELLHIREYIGKNHEHASLDFNVHQVEYYFVCKLKYEMNHYIKPTHLDKHQIGVEWLQINELLHHRVYPKQLRELLVKHCNGEKAPVYLGDIN